MASLRIASNFGQRVKESGPDTRVARDSHDTRSEGRAACPSSLPQLELVHFLAEWLEHSTDAT